MQWQLLQTICNYVFFIGFLLATFLYPLWSQIFGKKRLQTKSDFVFVTGKVSMATMMLSIARATLGVRGVIGFPSELYYYGSGMWESLYGMVTAYPIICFVFIPVYFNLSLTSVYHYLDLRFNSQLVRCLSSGTFVLRQLLSLGITLYTPAVALSVIADIPEWLTMLVLTGICIAFNLLGGLKAAINVDVIQAVTIILISLLQIGQGIYDSGGVKTVYERNRDNDRLKFFYFSGLNQRVDTVSAWIGNLFMQASLLGCQQNMVQRYVSLPSLKHVTRTLMSNIPVIIVLFSLSWLVGMCIYSTYFDCDPLSSGYIDKIDQLLPFYVTDRFSYIPGMTGIFMAALFNGALSMNVSNLNSVATVLWEDFVSLLPPFKGLSDNKQLMYIKLLSSITAIVILGFGFAISFLSGINESNMIASSVTTGALLGVFVLAMMIPVANWKGATVGIIISHLITGWMCYGYLSTTFKIPQKMLPTTTDGCSNHTFTFNITEFSTKPVGFTNDIYNVTDHFTDNIIAPVTESNGAFLDFMYSMSYMYYACTGTIVTVVIGTIVSWLTSSSADKYDPKLLHPFIYRVHYKLFGQQIYYSDTLEAGKSSVPTKTKSESINENQFMNLAFELESNGTGNPTVPPSVKSDKIQ